MNQHPLQVAPKADKGKEIVIKDVESPKKLVKASRKVHPDSDEPVRIKKAAEEAKLLAMTKSKLIKVIHEEASKAGIDPKVLESAKGSQDFQNIQDAEMKVLNREHSQKVKKAMGVKKNRIDDYMWTTSSRLKPEIIIDIKIHPNTKPTVITIYMGTNKRNFEVHNPFKFGDFGVTELDELGPIIQSKMNRIYGMFFIDFIGDKAFQRMSDIHKVDVETPLNNLVMASTITTPKNHRFCLKLRKLSRDHPDQEKLKSKSVKLEAVGYKLDLVLM
ncbi:hypothetical protein Tco_0930533 [Tanacetum coccineum]